MSQMLFRKSLIIHIVQDSHDTPKILVLAELAGEMAHRGLDR
jgi:hypothetical protein